MSRPDFKITEHTTDLLLHIGHSTTNTTVAKMWSLLSWASIALFASHVQALYFYIDGPTQKCFFEELPKDTLVVGMHRKHIAEHLLEEGHPSDT